MSFIINNFKLARPVGELQSPRILWCTRVHKPAQACTSLHIRRVGLIRAGRIRERRGPIISSVSCKPQMAVLKPHIWWGGAAAPPHFGSFSG
jgi:hypothetical protein